MKLSLQRLQQYAPIADAVLSTLEATDQRIFFGKFVELVGIKDPDEPFHARHRTEGSDVLNYLAEIEEDHGVPPIDRHEYWRVVNAATGEPGIGYQRYAERTADIH